MAKKQDPALESVESNESESDNTESLAETETHESASVNVENETQVEIELNDDLESELIDTEDETDALRVEVVTLRTALEAAKEQTLRAHAETDNVRRRMLRDIEKTEKYALDKFAEALLPVLDTFEQVLQVEGADAADANVFQGIELSIRKLHDTLGKFGIVSFDPQGEVFDPSKHKAMTEVPNPDMEPGTVLEVFRKGYLLHERLLRAAEVVVTK
ncbi:MAG: nucleotide exchange factor GrpE [Gammaproteobacteria bacterium]|nr:nucleotide exchange factor GrpE [Gammaproteobacteria bacterium]MXX95190.1 nucleotide exchange factor GrpE [Gammaproteobacteria bacterium]MYF53451.1 nucleotide exchange factor GrpE [Gammaproteobacteria bacterium]MYK42654.1 nucleotide exchange factor GrpE [Gammaproteobacteria bacterium]